jgi:hypothetical protein
MKQVVIVAPQFPPCNLTAGHRCRYFATHLPKFGWQVKVLTVEPDYYEEKLDYELEALLQPDLEIIRTKALPTRPLRLVGDIGIRTFWWHYQALCQLAKQQKPDLIYIPIPSNYSALLGILLYRQFGIPYAIDYIDPWVNTWPGSEVLFSKAWFSYNLGKFLEPIALQNVSLITAVAPGYYEGALKRYPWLDSVECVAMPYGIEATDFEYLDRHPRPPYLFAPDDGNFHIIYAGAMLPKAYSTLEALFQALCLLKESQPELAQKLKFHFVGTGKDPSDIEGFNIKPWAEKYQLLDMVTEYPARIPYLDVLNHLKNAHAVLIVGSPERHYTPSKVFQAVLSHRPVIALLHQDSTAVSILKQVNTGTIVGFDEQRTVDLCVEEIAQCLEKVVKLPYSTKDINWDAFYTYSTQAMAEKLAHAFNLAIDKQQ